MSATASSLPVIESFPVGPLQCNCTILGDPLTKQALVIDPGGDADQILARLKTLDLTVTRIVHTHAHFDHFMASGELKAATQASLGLHPDDRPLWDALEQQCSMFDLPCEAVPPPDSDLSHEEPLEVGPFQGEVLHTPGHTPGSVCFHFPTIKLLCSGDTLFKGSIGRTDLWGGDYATIERSIKTRLYTLDEDLVVIPGHGPKTLLGQEMRHNMFIRCE